MAKQRKEIDANGLALIQNRSWLEFLKSLKSGIYEVKLPSFSEVRSIQVTASKVNADTTHGYIIATQVNYKDVSVTINVDKR